MLLKLLILLACAVVALAGEDYYQVSLLRQLASNAHSSFAHAILCDSPTALYLVYHLYIPAVPISLQTLRIDHILALKIV